MLVLALPFAVLVLLIALLLRRKRGDETPPRVRALASRGGARDSAKSPPSCARASAAAGSPFRTQGGRALAAEPAFVAAPEALAPLALPDNLTRRAYCAACCPAGGGVPAASSIEGASSSVEPLGEGEDEMIKHIGPIPDPKDNRTNFTSISKRLSARAIMRCWPASASILAQATPSDPRIPEVLRKCVRAAMRSKSFAVHAAARPRTCRAGAGCG